MLGLGGLVWINSIHTTIRNFGTASFGVNLNSLIFVVGNSIAGIGVCKLSGAIHAATSSLVESWRRGGKRINEKQKLLLQSTLPFGIHVASFYVMKNTSSITYLQIIFDNTVNALIGF